MGSGVLLLSQPRTRIASDPQAEGESTDEVYETLLLTAWHVVRDIRAGAREESAPIPVTIYGEDGSVQYATAQLLLQEEDLDPWGPTLRAAMKQSLPKPGPRSRTRWPGSRLLSPVGTPQP